MFVGNNEYEIIDVIENITLADSFVKVNKIGRGNGEAKLYICQDTDTKKMSFFDITERRGDVLECFVLKSDLLQYLDAVKGEYLRPTQKYQDFKNMPDNWIKWYDEIGRFDENELFFEMQDQIQVEPPRVYFNAQKNYLYTLIREIALPNYSYLSCLKLKNKQNNKIFFYIRIFADLEKINMGSDALFMPDTNQNITLIQTEKNILTTRRNGQEIFRKKLLERCPFCPITLIDDERLLIASHIKPWRICNDKERLDPHNGLMFTPNIDRLFDQGFITFSDAKEMLLSQWLSKETYAKMGLIHKGFYAQLPIEKSWVYLEFHRNNVFKSISNGGN